jgi:hypothetical protein
MSVYMQWRGRSDGEQKKRQEIVNTQKEHTVQWDERMEGDIAHDTARHTGDDFSEMY